MPTQKDLKRLVRSRMKKTGESYTAARAQLLKKKPSTHKKLPEPAEYARLAGMSEDAVKAKTGCNWERWVNTLDRFGADKMPHCDVAQLVHDKFKIDGWWAQTVTVGYERIRGLREIGQRRDGAYEANKSKTVAVPIAKLYSAFSTKRTRDRWLADKDLKIRTSTREKSMHITWDDGTLVQVYFTKKGPAKSQVAIQHTRLPDKAAVTKMKEYWAERLGELAKQLSA